VHRRVSGFLIVAEYYGRGGRRPRIEECPNAGRPAFLGTISIYLRGTDDGTKWRLAFVSYFVARQSSIDISTRGDRFAQLYDVTCQGGVVQPLI